MHGPWNPVARMGTVVCHLMSMTLGMSFNISVPELLSVVHGVTNNTYFIGGNTWEGLGKLQLRTLGKF